MSADRSPSQYKTPTRVRVFYFSGTRKIAQVMIRGGQFQKNKSKSKHADPKPYAVIDCIYNDSWKNFERCLDWVIWAQTSGWECTVKNNIEDWRPKDG